MADMFSLPASDHPSQSPEDAAEHHLRALKTALSHVQTLEKLLAQMKDMVAGAATAPDDDHPRIQGQFNALAQVVGELARQSGLDDDDDARAAARALAELGWTDGAAPQALAPAVNDALVHVQAAAQALGARIGQLQARLGTGTAMDTDTIAPAELNAEGAKLLALRTRQQVGEQSLSFAGPMEHNLLALFR